MDGNISNEFTVEPDALHGEIEELASMAKSVGEANGALRNRIKQIIEEKGYHPMALADSRKIDRMSETKRADYLRTFRPMFAAMYESKWRGQAADMVDFAEE